MYSLTLQSILNEVQPIKGFVCESVKYSVAVAATIEVAVVPRKGSKAQCSRSGRSGPTYDPADRPRVWIMPPRFKFALALIDTLRRVNCRHCGVGVEKVPWATGKHGLCAGFRLLLARGARKLSREETALRFKVSWADVYASLQWGVEYGLRQRVLENLQASGLDAICVRVGRGFWTLIDQIDAHLTRLLWVGQDGERTPAPGCLGPCGPGFRPG